MSANLWAEGVADQLARLLDELRDDVATAAEFGRRWRYSKEQARHILNRAAEYGTVEKLSAAPTLRAGARYVFRVKAQP